MLARLRDRVWWPKLDQDGRAVVKKCRSCLLVSQPNPPEPMQRRQLPNEPWTDLAIDFLGPLPSGDYIFVIVDYYSRFKIVKIMTRITAKDTVNVLRPIFEDQAEGYPKTITLDNGRQFIAKDFVEYCQSKCITLNYTTPYWPQANGQVERQNRSLLKRLRISHQKDRDWKEDLKRYVMMYNTTPHAVTGKPPAELMKGRRIRTEIPTVKELELGLPTSDNVRDRDAVAKEKGKEMEDIRRGAKESTIVAGDTVVLKNQTAENKLSSTFRDEDFTVLEKSGNRLTVQSQESGAVYQRAVAHAKKVFNPDTDSSATSSNQPASFEPAVTSTPLPAERPKRNAKRPERFNDEEYTT